MATNFHIWTLNQVKQSACTWYRIMVPMMELRDRGLAHIFEDDGVNTPMDVSKLALMHSDVGHLYSVHSEQILHEIRTMKRIKPGRRKTDEGMIDVFPPAMIWDYDDNTDFVHPFNQTFVHNGVRGYPDARLLKPGEGLDIRDFKGDVLRNAEGKEIGWVDGETVLNGTVFSIERNLKNMMLRHTIMRECHGITTASSVLTKYTRDVVGCKNVYTFPNSIDPKHYETIRAVRTDKRIRILWQGGMSHLIDWYPLREAIKTICQKYKDQVTFVLFGEYFDWINDVIPQSMLEFHHWVEYPAYKLKRGLLNVDINLCPLVNNVFNSCKSAIKWYESAIFADQIEATLAQRGSVFNEIEDGVTGLLFDTPTEFTEKLSLLIEDAQLRARLHAGAHKWVLDNRTTDKTIPGLFEFYAETRARQKRDLGQPIIKPASHDEIMKLTTPLR